MLEKEPFAMGLRTTYYLEENPPSSDVLNEGPVSLVQVLRIPLQPDEVQQLYLFIQQVQAQRDKPTHTTVGDITLSYNPSGRTEQVVISRYQRRIGMALATALRLRDHLLPYLPTTLRTPPPPEQEATVLEETVLKETEQEEVEQ